MKPYSILFIIAFAAGIVSCKKNNTDPYASVSDPSGKQLSNWYNEQLKTVSGKTMAVLGADQPDWGQSKFFDDPGLYITPVTLKEKGTAAKFFSARKDGGSFKDGSYFIFLTKRGTVPGDPEQLILNHSSTVKAVNGNFSGAVLQYDMENKLISAAHYKNGTRMNTSDIIVYKPEKTKVKDEEGPVGGVAPLECGENAQQFCIDWYWQTYEEGVLVEEEYLFTTCYCATNGGGSGTTNVPCTQANQQFANMGHVVDGVVTESTIFNSPLTWKKGYNWLIFQAGPWGLLSYEEGILKKVLYPNNVSLWEFQSFQHLSVAEAGMNIGGSRTFTVIPPTINISPSKTSVYIQIDFTVTSKVACTGAFPITQPFNANKHFQAPNGFVIAQ